MNFASALTVRGEYLTPKLARIQPSEAILISLDGTAVTNGDSNVPVIGTTALAVCAGLIAYNRSTKTAAITHVPHPDEATVKRLLKGVRGDTSDQVEFHVIGKPAEPGSTATEKSINAERMYELSNVLDALEAAGNVTLKTFDVYDKPKPYNVAIDARSGKLIRGSDLFTTFQQVEDDIYKQSSGSDLFKGFEQPLQGKNFDGTSPAFRKSRHH